MKTYGLFPVLSLSLLAALFMCSARAEELTDQDREMANTAAELYRAADFDAVWKLASDFKKAQPKWTGGTCVMFENWENSIPKSQNHAALLFLGRVIEHFPDDNAVAFAWALKGEIYSEQDRAAEMWDAYSHVVKLPPIKEPWKVGIGEPTPYNTAFEEIGQRQMTRRQFKDALACWESWPAWHWCGNCGDSLRAYRQKQIMVCLLQLGEHRKAAEFTLKVLEQDPNLDGSGVQAVAYLGYQLYRRSGQDDVLVARAKEIQRVKDAGYDARRNAEFLSHDNFISLLPAATVVQCDDIRRLSGDKQLQELVDLCVEGETIDSSRGWYPRFLAEAVAERGEKLIPELESRILARPDRSAWLIFALGRIASAKAEVSLQRIAIKKDVDTVLLRNVITAIGIRGPQGKKTSSELLTARRDQIDTENRKVIESVLFDLSLEHDWSDPVKGSLPKK